VHLGVVVSRWPIGRKMAAAAMPKLRYYSRPRIGALNRGRAAAVPTQFVSLSGGVTIGQELGDTPAAPCDSEPAAPENCVCFSWSDATEAGAVEERRVLAWRLKLVAALDIAVSLLLSFGASSVVKDAHPLRCLLGVLVSAWGALAAHELSAAGLTIYIAATVLGFVALAPSLPLFIFALRYPIDAAGAYAAYKLRNHLLLCWIHPVNPQMHA